jgi:SAM-dependent MidA family methyltransferase
MSPLQQIIIERIRRNGPITFADYMRMALYEPGYGYYVSGAYKMGWEGDYYTSSDVSDLFAHCMGRQLCQMWQQLGQPAPFVVLEQGAGRGQLAQGVRTWAEQEAPAFGAALDYRGEDIRSGQDASAPHDEKAPSPSVILSNELVDAFPVHIVEKRGSRLYEIYVTEQQGHLYEVLDEPGTPEVAGYLDRYKIPWTTFDDGWRAEINLDALHWIERCARLLLGYTSPVRQDMAAARRARKRHGFLLTIDYGDKARALYTPYRPRGTLACYYRHRLLEQPLIHPGEQDITAHVNFSALIDEGRRHGLRLHTFTTQRLWLTAMGIYEELERTRQRDFAVIDSERGSDRGQTALLQWYMLRQRVSALTEPAGMGNFKILIMKA